MTFAGTVCWDPSGLADVIVADAVTPSDAVFLATHTPIELFRREFGDASPPQRCSEEDLLQDFLREDIDMLLLPITGASGRGKSHLVRWLQARIQPTPGRRVVYIPKYQTNLRGVIEAILGGMDGEATTAIRRQLAQAADNLDESTAPDRLVDSLAIRISQAGAAAAGVSKDQLRRYACQGLPTLLREHLFREVWLAEGGVIRRFVSEALKGRARTDREEPFAFTVDDLPRSVTAVGKASERARGFYQQLIANIDLQRACVDALNESLAPAIAEVVGLKTGDLQKILLDLRRILLAQNKELLILIEDFAILQGVQRELLEAIVEAPTRGGSRVLCNIRVAMAVTSGYFASLDTVLTRAKFKGYVYNLDVPHSDGEHLRLEVIEFVARYLNSARVGRSTLDQAFDASTPDSRGGANWVPNACARCEHRSPCHGAFGANDRGWSLYPFNAVALERMLRARSGEQFDPREVLGGILYHTLFVHADDLRNCSFPNKNYAERFVSDRVDPVAASLEATVAQDKTNGGRRLPLLVLWGGNPRDAINLNAGLHDAFAIPPLATLKSTRPTAPPPSAKGGKSETSPPPDPQTSALMSALQRLDSWKDGTLTLPQDIRRELASAVAEAIQELIDWNDFCCPKLADDDQRFDASSVRFEAAYGEASRVPRISVRISRSVENARALQATLLYRHHRHWRFDGGASYLRAFSRALDRWAAEVRSQYDVPATHETARELVAHLVAYAAFGARVLGEPRSRSDKLADLLSAAFEKGPAPPKTWPSGERPWIQLQAAIVSGPTRADPSRSHLLERLLFLAARSQAGGSPQAIDVAVLLEPIRQLKRTWRPAPPPAGAPPWLSRYFDRVEPRIEPAIIDERERLSAWEGKIRRNFASAQSPKALKEAILAGVESVVATDEAARAQALRRPGSTEKVARMDELVGAISGPTAGFGLVFDIWEYLACTDPFLGDTLAKLSTDRRRQEEPLEAFVSVALEFLSQTEAFVEQQKATLAQSQSALGPTVADITNALAELTASLSEAKGGAS